MPRFQQTVIIASAACLIAAVPAAKFAQQAAPVTPPAVSKPQDPAQNPAAQSSQDVVRISTQLVQVDAVVTDKKGKHIEDLTEADFELLVDGKKQTLTHFSHFSLPPVKRIPPSNKKADAIVARESMPTRQLAPEEVRRTIAFIVDDLGLSISSSELVRETLRKFVREQMQEGDLVAIIRTGNGLGTLEQFTSDKRILYTAIDRLIWNPLSRDMMPTFSDSSTSDETDDFAADRQASLDSFDELVNTNFTTGTLGAIKWVVRGLRELPGRKSVILLSDGFRIFSQTDNDNTSDVILQRLEQLIELANRSSVVIYSIDAKGLQPFYPGASVGGRPGNSMHSDALGSAQEALEGPTFLAQQTGGFTVVNTNDLNIGVGEVLYDQRSYYLLGFDPENEKFDRRRHSIKVRVTRPGATVRSRSGFFGIDDGDRREQPKTRSQQIFTGILSPLGTRDLALKMTPYFFNSSKDGPLVRALFQIDCSNLTFKDGPNGRKHLDFDLAAFAFDEEGVTADLAARRLVFDLDENQYRQAISSGLAYQADFQLKEPGAYQFRAVLRDSETGRTGSASQFIRVPDLNKRRLELSGLVLTAPKNIIESDEAAKAVSASAEKEPGDKLPTTDLQTTPYVRRFPRTGWIQYGAAIYNATSDKKTNQPQITAQVEIYQDGKPVYQLPARTLEFSPGTNPKRFDYVSRLRLNNFPAGEYLLHLVVTDGLARKKYARAEQWMDFSVR